MLTCPCIAKTITVDDDGPADFNNIQAAISDANDGDTVLVKDGRYTGTGNRDIDFRGKAITVRSENGPENCIIDCNGTEGDWTVEAWVLFQSNSDRYNLVCHCSEDANGPSPYRLFIESGKACFQLEDSNNSVMIQSDISPLVGLWVHLAGVYRNGQCTELYVDGLRVACMTTTLTPETLPNYNVFVGGSFCGTSTGLKIDEVRISNVARYGNPESQIDLCSMVNESQDRIIPNDLMITDHSFSYSESITIIATGTNLSRPRINDNGEVVWSHKDDVQGYMIYSNMRGQISDGPKDRDPDINNDGEIIWRFGDGGQSANGIQSNLRGLIYLGRSLDPYYDTHRINNESEIVYNRNLWRFGERVEEIWSNTRGRLTYSPKSTRNRWCAINDSGEVAYVSYRNPLTNNLYDIISTERGVITNDHPYPHKRGPDINNDGEIVWHEDGKVWSNVRGKIGDGVNPSINDMGEIVWQGSDYQIYSNIRGQITNNNKNNIRPQINNNGQITWLVNSNQIALFSEPTPIACIVGGDRVVEAGEDCEGRVVLDGSCSSDADSAPGTNDDINDFDWYVVDACDPNFEDYLGSGEVIECNLPLGENIIVLEVTDTAGAFDNNEVTITVADVTGPEFSLTVEPNELWPPNHKMVLITVEWEVSDNCDDEPEVRLVSITSSEEDDGKGDGATSDDIVIGEDGSIYLRAERAGYLEGRVYTITYEAVDDSGNATVQSAEVVVPDGYRWRHRERITIIRRGG